MIRNPGNYIYGVNGQQLVANQDPLTKTAQSGQQYLAQQALLNPQINYLMGTMSGQHNNPYEGDNPYLNGMVNASNTDITNAFQHTTQAAHQGAAARAGAFGGSGDLQQQGIDNKALADSLAQNESNLRGQNYYNSANLANQDSANALNAAGQMTGVNNAEMQNLAALNQSGQQNQAYGQSQIDAQKALMNQIAQWQSSVMDLRGNALSRASGQGGSSTASTLGPGFSTAQGGLGGLLALLGSG
jgi:hypothetical protein